MLPSVPVVWCLYWLFWPSPPDTSICDSSWDYSHRKRSWGSLPELPSTVCQGRSCTHSSAVTALPLNVTWMIVWCFTIHYLLTQNRSVRLVKPLFSECFLCLFFIKAVKSSIFFSLSCGFKFQSECVFFTSPSYSPSIHFLMMLLVSFPNHCAWQRYISVVLLKLCLNSLSGAFWS